MAPTLAPARTEAGAALPADLSALQRALQDWRLKRKDVKQSLTQLLKTLELDSCLTQGNARAISPNQSVVHGRDLVVMTLNLQYYASYPLDLEKAKRKLRQALGGPQPPDVICVQEGLAERDVLHDIGFELVACAGAQGVAQSVRDMVYSDHVALKGCHQETHDKLLCNQFYVRKGSPWVIEDWGAEQISSDLQLAGGGNRVCSNLAVRSMVWVKMRKNRKNAGPAVYLMCTHITGGRFEDQYFVQQLMNERRRQPERCDEFFKRRPNPHPEDLGILVGDFNATEEYLPDGPMHGYFKCGIANSPGVLEDAQAAGIGSEAELEEHFKAYMVSPFKALRDQGWTFAYGDEIGITSAFGHLIDHMALSRPVPVKGVEVIHLTNQKVGGAAPDTDVVITDHNAVKVTLAI